ncbi:MAG TPA: outer membrane beta-barrel protein [Bdellovibrionota bacterium]|jgi:hypothetical protein|nr:outer membrane beta-barrel protein [Bdellovibrionota bacterium]
MSLKLKVSQFLIATGLIATAMPAHALVSLGIKGGAGLASIVTVPQTLNMDYEMGMIGGLSLDVNAGLVGFVVDALFAQRKLSSDASSTLNFLHIPAQIKLSLIPALFTTAGGYYAIGLNKENFSGMKTTDYGAVFGVGVGLNGITFEARYNLGLANVLEGGTDSNSIKTRSVDLLLGYQF